MTMPAIKAQANRNMNVDIGTEVYFVLTHCRLTAAKVRIILRNEWSRGDGDGRGEVVFQIKNRHTPATLTMAPMTSRTDTR